MKPYFQVTVRVASCAAIHDLWRYLSEPQMSKSLASQILFLLRGGSLHSLGYRLHCHPYSLLVIACVNWGIPWTGIGWFARQGGAGGYVTPGYSRTRSIYVVYEVIYISFSVLAPLFIFSFNAWHVLYQALLQSSFVFWHFFSRIPLQGIVRHWIKAKNPGCSICQRVFPYLGIAILM